MFRYNSDHIMVGQIKQILKKFNLPNYKVYTKEHDIYFNDTGVEHPSIIEGIYIKRNKLQLYKDGQWTTVGTYGYNNKILNASKNLRITNNIYDNHTHEYLGEFLRFQRDFLGLDLMSLYNCFGKNVCNHIDLAINKKDKAGKTVRHRHVFWSKDKDSTIFMVPIKFFKEYTIAIDSSSGVEMCCGFFNDYLEELPEKYDETYKYKKWDAEHKSYTLEELTRRDLNQIVADRTYNKSSELRFNHPFIWDNLSTTLFNKILEDCVGGSIEEIDTEVDDDETIALKQERLQKANAYKQQILSKESDLKLFIKIPTANKTSIVVLEGNYIGYNDLIYRYVITSSEKRLPLKDEEGNYIKTENGDFVYDENTQIVTSGKWERKQNRFVTNYETVLLGEGTTPEEVIKVENPEVEDRPFKPISPLQLLMLNTGESYPFADRLIEYLTGNVITDFDSHTDNIRRVQKVLATNNNTYSIDGAWEGKMRNILYDYMMVGKPNGEYFTYNINHDTLGYVDKDVEKFYTAWKHEYCRDINGNYIPLTEKTWLFNEDGTPKYNEDGTRQYIEEPLLREVNIPLTEADKQLLLETRSFLLMIGDVANIPMYKEVYKPMYTISNVDIYEEEK